MSAIKLHVLKPSVNNMTARVFVRAGKLDFTEDDAWGKTRSDDFLASNPAHLTPMIESAELPKGVMWESCAIMQYLCNKHGLDALLSEGAGSARDGRQRDVLYHRHALSLCRARDLSGARLPAICRRSRRQRRRPGRQGARRRRRRRPRSPSRSRCSTVLYERQAVHRRRPSRRSPTSASPRRSSSSPSSTTSCRPGPSSS